MYDTMATPTHLSGPQPARVVQGSYVATVAHPERMHGGVTGKILENHMRENIGWILFKTHNFYIF